MVLIPKDNEPALYEVDPVVKQALEFHPVSSLDEVLSLALLKDKKKAKHPEKTEKKVQHPVPEIKTEQPLAIPQ